MFWEYILQSTDRERQRTRITNQRSSRVLGVCGELEFSALGMEDLLCGIGRAIQEKKKNAIYRFRSRAKRGSMNRGVPFSAAG